MGAYTNSAPLNVIAWLATIAMIILTLVLVVTQIFPFGG
jgi:Mn2+/Fe2+ NRAMP family transporter